MIRLYQGFVKITAWIAQFFCFRTKIYYQDKRVQKRKIKGSAIIASNHTSVYDYAVMLFVFPWRTLRYLMAEILFEGKRLGRFLRHMGGIKVDRTASDFSFLLQTEEILEKGGVVGSFPEGRLPDEGEQRPLPFKPSTAYIALQSGAPVIPVYTNGSYFCRRRARVMIGVPMYAADYVDETASQQDNVQAFNTALRNRIIQLGEELEKRTGKTK